ncbi:venom carboxylesterase-6 [Ceratitis capitata]|uniref:venom carboxylesterase-6 n=1 Tax=Ceratitis capitata TaxID=7213 RepID=UPI000329F035|nr:venom carboxylesterase-6 [Ceratitis capitata]
MLLRIFSETYRFSRNIAFRYYSANPIKTVKVQVRQGVVVGREERLPNGEPYNAFQGVRYAVPPLGKLRFQPPQPLERFETPELDCTRVREPSAQRDRTTNKFIGSEDCLYINIYVPVKSSLQPLPVIVWAHGGAFTFGHGQSFLPLSLMMEDVIVVSINYRLGVLGFGCLPEIGFWGNAGAKDQLQALRWVQENIACFNGDPGNVTLMGESAGGVCVNLHTLGCNANKLFHKAIMLSGMVNIEWAFQRTPQEKMYRLCEMLGCPSKDPKKILEFLQTSEKAAADKILSKTNSLILPDERRRSSPVPVSLVLEDPNSPDPIISTPVLDLMRTENTLNVPTIIGHNSAEGIMVIEHWFKKLDEVDQDLERFLPRNIPLPKDHPHMKVLAEKIRKFYFGGGKVTFETLQGLSNLLSDYICATDIKLAVEMLATYQPQAPIYAFNFNYNGARDYFKRIKKSEHLEGACHTDELFYLFQSFTDDLSTFNEHDLQITKRMSAMWANFARHSDPTPMDSDITKELGFRWTPVGKPAVGSDLGQDYLIIDRHMRMQDEPAKERGDFWREIYRSYPPLDYSVIN